MFDRQGYFPRTRITGSPDRQTCERPRGWQALSLATGKAEKPQRGRRAAQTRNSLALGTAIACLLGGQAAAQQAFTPALVPAFNMGGGPGIVDMPSAEMAPDATFSSTLSYFGGTTRSTLTFQITPRLSGSFRYSAIKGLTELGGVDIPDYDKTTYFDRSFDLRYQILTETKTRPAVTIGAQDFVGTAIYGAEYVVATKALTPTLRVTGGLGWGRLGSHGAIGSTGTRPGALIDEGGMPNFDRWFRGDMAPFGGIAWAATDRLTLHAEYSSDAYVEEKANGVFTPKSPWNFGINYRLGRGTHLSLHALHGSEVGAAITMHTNPRVARVPGGIESAPVPVYRRDATERHDPGWQDNAATVAGLPARLSTAMARESLVMAGLDLTTTTATVRLINHRYGSEPQALGRTARVMARNLPGTIETFVIVPVVDGMALSAVTFRRGDLEDLENAPATALLARTRIEDGYGRAPDEIAGLTEPFTWSLGPYLRYSLFDPDNPLRANLGLRLRADYRLAPNLVLSGALSKQLLGNLDTISRRDPSALPRVRTDYALYAREGDPAIDQLTLTGFARPGPDLYGRLSVGYLEAMYAGISGELLWKPVDSRLALGVEVNYVAQRDYDQLFGLRDYEVLTGHLSAYYDLGRGYHGRLDVGRYLAGDVGATLSLDREFANGWKLGVFATVTDVSSADFGEGSFDKGFHLTVPLSFALGTPSRRATGITIRPLTRDGGARLHVDGRLYERVRDYHRPELETQWGRVWR